MAEKTYPCRRCSQPTRVENDFFPFCSKRCRMIDLGKWLDEDYKIEKDSKEWRKADIDQA